MKDLVDAVRKNALPMRYREQIINGLEQREQLINGLEQREQIINGAKQMQMKGVYRKKPNERGKNTAKGSNRLGSAPSLLLTTPTNSPTNSKSMKDLWRRINKKGGSKSHKPKFTRRKNKNLPKRKSIKKRKMQKRNTKTRRQRK